MAYTIFERDSEHYFFNGARDWVSRMRLKHVLALMNMTNAAALRP